MLDISKLAEDILSNLRSRGHSDAQIAAMSPQKALDEHLAWILGYPGWGDDMLNAWERIQEAEKGESNVTTPTEEDV